MGSSDYEQNLSGTRTRIPVRIDAEIAPSCSGPVEFRSKEIKKVVLSCLEPEELLDIQSEGMKKLSCSELVEPFPVTSDNPDISFEKRTQMHRWKWMQNKVHRAEV